MTGDRPCAEGGFTLLELLISIAIFGLILVALLDGVHFAGRAWSTQEQRASRQGDIDAVQNVLRNIVVSGSEFRGDPLSLQFVGRPPVALARGGLFDLGLYSAGGLLVLSWRPHFRGPSTGLGQKDAVLLNGVESIAVAYYVTQQGWQPMANDKLKPRLIRIALHLADGRSWPLFIVAPAIEALPAKD